MKMKKIIGILLICLLVSFFCTTVKAEMIINGGDSYCNISVSDSFKECYDLRNETSTLGKNSLDPHLIKNTEWGAIAYLAKSRYGSNDGNSRNTTGNASGVMNMVVKAQTASIREDRSITSVYLTNLNNAVNNADMKKYVEILPTSFTVENTKGMALKETDGWFSSSKSYPDKNYPMAIRDSLFGVFSHPYSYGDGAGESSPAVTFRPVIWN